VDTKFKGVSTSKMSWSEGGRPTGKNIVKTKVNHPGGLGYETWSKSRSGKVSIKGGQK